MLFLPAGPFMSNALFKISIIKYICHILKNGADNVSIIYAISHYLENSYSIFFCSIQDILPSKKSVNLGFSKLSIFQTLFMEHQQSHKQVFCCKNFTQLLYNVDNLARFMNLFYDGACQFILHCLFFLPRRTPCRRRRKCTRPLVFPLI